MRRKTSFILTLLSIAGCTVGPNYTAPNVTVNGAYSEAVQASATTQPTTMPSRVVTRAIPLAEWWTTFHDAELDALVDRALRANLDLRVAEARVREARAQRAVVAGGEYPTVDFTGSAQQFRVSKNGIPIPGVSTGAGANNHDPVAGVASPRAVHSGGSSSSSGGGSNSGGSSSLFDKSELSLYQLGFDASWEIDLFGRVRRGVQAADADLAASVEDRRDVLVTVLAEVARNYVELRGAQRQIAIAQQNLKAQQETLFLTQNRAQNGLTPQLDVSRAAAQVASTAAQIPPLVNRTRVAIHALGVLTGQDPSALSAELTPPADVPPAPAEVPVGVPAELLRRRPDVRRAERQLAAATARLGVATADLYPRFSLSGTFALQSTKPKSLFDWDSRTFAIGPAVNWPVFDFGRIRANIRAYDARQQQAMATYEQTVLRALADVENAISGFESEQLRRRALQDAVTASTASLDDARDQYKNGVADFLTVLDAERNLFLVEDQLAQSEQSVSTNLVALYKALGGGWEIEQAPADR